MDTYLPTIWKVAPGTWTKDALIDFAFNNVPQDIDKFRNSPYWRDRFGDNDPRFQWTQFYETIADKLLDFREDRTALIKGIHEIAARLPETGFKIMQDKFVDGSTRPLEDICPFTAMAIFNRGNSDANRKAIATEFANFLKVDIPVPESFEGIPVVNNQRTWFFAYAKDRKDDDIDKLWRVFAEGITSLDRQGDSDSDAAFVEAFDDALQVWGTKWNLTFGLYWSRPWGYQNLDAISRGYLEKELSISLGKEVPSGTEYLNLLVTLVERFEDENCPVHSFPELSLAAWNDKDNLISDDSDNLEDDFSELVTTVEEYSVESIIRDGCFLDKDQLQDILARFRSKKNLILQGPPGTGKTWLAKRLAFALMGHRNNDHVRVVQFHPNLSYEDFIRGWRPSGDGKLSRCDGPFMQMITAAKNDPENKYVTVIEEVNRGNPAQVFGEMLTLLEADKRNGDCAIELCYSSDGDEPVFIPPNLYVIGTMNIADRSLTIVDFALRRRFAFVNLQPRIGDEWLEWIHEKNGIDKQLLQKIQSNMQKLNKGIAEDNTLGSAFEIGHSFVTPSSEENVEDAGRWFREIVETEIGPLLDEYWFDNAEKAKKSIEQLLEGF